MQRRKGDKQRRVGDFAAELRRLGGVVYGKEGGGGETVSSGAQRREGGMRAV